MYRFDGSAWGQQAVVAHPSSLNDDFAQDTATTTGTTYGYKAGRIALRGIVALVASSTIALTVSATNYVEVSGAGTVSANTTGFTAGKFAMAIVVTSSSAITSVTDKRYFVTAPREVISGGTIGQLLAKNSSSDNDTTWVDPSSVSYALPVSTASVLGGIKFGHRLTVNSSSGVADVIDPSTGDLTDFAQDTATTTGTTYGYKAGGIRSDAVPASVSAGTIALTVSATNYVEVSGAGTVSANTTGFTPGRLAMAVVVTSSSAITSVTDKRAAYSISSAVSGTAPVTIASSTTPAIGAATSQDVTLSGTALVTGFDTCAAGTKRFVTYSGEVPMAHNAVSLILVGSQNRTNHVGDVSLFQSLGSANWKELDFQRVAGVREVLTAARTYYVRTDGSDSNNGLANTAGGAFLTIQKAVDVLCNTLDNNGNAVTIQVADGTYTGAVSLKTYVGSAMPTVQGNNGAPANVLISVTSANAFALSSAATWQINDLKIVTTTSGYCITATNNARIGFSNINFGAGASGHILGQNYGVLTATGNYAISGGAPFHIIGTDGAAITIAGMTVTLTGTPTWGTAFCYLRTLAILSTSNTATFTGAATGSRYNISLNAAAFVNGQGTAYFPGSTAGATATGGQYG
jgi:hypothetical protein